MALQLIYGNSGSGKSTYIYEKVIQMAQADRRRNFYVIVPEQFTMQTQRELVCRSENHVIINIDVVSFERLAYRIFDELGIQNTVMEETGKSLILRKIAEEKGRNLTVLRGNIRKMGYINELKSMISELMQYDISAEKLIHNLMDKYQDEGRGIHIIELENSYQLCTKRDYYGCLIRIAMQPQKPALTDVMLETLSIIAYKQPVTKAEIEKIRGVKSDHAVNKLVEYNLVKELGRLDAPGRPILFGTTEEFLRTFGVQGLEELPSVDPVKMADFKAEAEEEIQLKLDV